MGHNLFVPDLSVAEKVIRPVLVYLFLVVAVRLAGRRELAQLNSFDLVMLMMLANTVQNATIGNDNSMVSGLIGVSALLLVNYVVTRVLYQHPRLDRVIEGEPAVLVRDGQLLRERLAQQAITEGELMEAIRKQGLGSVDQVAQVVLESGWCDQRRAADDDGGTAPPPGSAARSDRGATRPGPPAAAAGLTSDVVTPRVWCGGLTKLPSSPGGGGGRRHEVVGA